MSDEHGLPETSHSNYILSVVGAVGSMLLFGFIIFIAYVPNRPEPVNEEIVAQRKANLAEVQAAQSKAATSYSWVNEQEGVVRIPIEQAMKISAERLGKGEPAFVVKPAETPETPVASKSTAKGVGPASQGGKISASSDSAPATEPATAESMAGESAQPKTGTVQTEAGDPTEKDAEISTPISSKESETADQAENPKEAGDSEKE